MAEVDLQRFLEKVKHLQMMVKSLDDVPNRREVLASCTDHNQVVELARSWGYEIGRRWGELQQEEHLKLEDNLLAKAIPLNGHEQRHLIQEGSDWKLELVLSSAVKTPKGLWHDQDKKEWILILRGSASFSFKGPDALVDLSAGDHLYLAPNRLHRFERTDPHPGTTWLSLRW